MKYLKTYESLFEEDIPTSDILLKMWKESGMPFSNGNIVFEIGDILYLWWQHGPFVNDFSQKSLRKHIRTNYSIPLTDYLEFREELSIFDELVKSHYPNVEEIYVYDDFLKYPREYED